MDERTFPAVSDNTTAGFVATGMTHGLTGIPAAAMTQPAHLARLVAMLLDLPNSASLRNLASTDSRRELSLERANMGPQGPNERDVRNVQLGGQSGTELTIFGLNLPKSPGAKLTWPTAGVSETKCFPQTPDRRQLN